MGMKSVGLATGTTRKGPGFWILTYLVIVIAFSGSEWYTLSNSGNAKYS